MEIETFTKSQDSSATEFPNALVVTEKPSEAGRSDCSFNFSYRNYGFSIKILTDVCFTYTEKEIQHRCSLSFKPNRIRFLLSLL